jgi:hypothetical protein
MGGMRGWDEGPACAFTRGFEILCAVVVVAAVGDENEAAVVAADEDDEGGRVIVVEDEERGRRTCDGRSGTEMEMEER